MTMKTWATAIAVSVLAISAAAAVEVMDSAHCSPKARAVGVDAPVFVTVQMPGERFDAGGLPDRKGLRQTLVLPR
jgi:hypothetical protein